MKSRYGERRSQGVIPEIGQVSGDALDEVPCAPGDEVFVALIG